MVPDYYARLEVDPKADRAEIEAALQRKQPAWSMGTRNPKNRQHISSTSTRSPRCGGRSWAIRPAARRTTPSWPSPAGPSGSASSTSCNGWSASAPPRGDSGRPIASCCRRGDPARAERGGPAAAHPADPESRPGGERQRRRRDRHRPAGRRPRPVHPPADPRGAGAPGPSRPVRRPGRHARCPGLRHRRPRRCRAPAVDEEGPGHRREDRLARGRRPRAVAPRLARSRARYDRTLALEAEEAFDDLARFTLKGLGRLDQGTRAALVAEAAALGIAPRSRRSPHRPRLPATGRRARGGTRAPARLDDDGAASPRCGPSSIATRRATARRGTPCCDAGIAGA